MGFERLLPAVDDMIPYLVNHRDRLNMSNLYHRDNDDISEEEATNRFIQNLLSSMRRRKTASISITPVETPKHAPKKPSEQDLADVAYNIGKTLATQAVMSLVPEARPLQRIVGRSMLLENKSEPIVEDILTTDVPH